MSFNNNFNGPIHGNVTQAGRDVYINASPEDAVLAAHRLRALLADLEVDRPQRRIADAELDAIERELRTANPDRQEVARRLERATEVLKSAGALAAAGTALLGPIGIIAGFLGPLGEAAMKLVR